MAQKSKCFDEFVYNSKHIANISITLVSQYLSICRFYDYLYTSYHVPRLHLPYSRSSFRLDQQPPLDTLLHFLLPVSSTQNVETPSMAASQSTRTLPLVHLAVQRLRKLPRRISLKPQLRAFAGSPRLDVNLTEDVLVNLKVKQDRLMADIHHTCQWGTGERWGP